MRNAEAFSLGSAFCIHHSALLFGRSKTFEISSVFACIPSPQKLHQQFHLRVNPVLQIEIRQGGGEGGFVSIEKQLSAGFLNFLDISFGKAGAPQAFAVHRADTVFFPEFYEGGNIVMDAGHPGDERVVTDCDIVMGGGSAGHHHVVAHMHVTGQHHVIRQDGVVSDLAIVTDVAVYHQQIAVTDAGDTAAECRCRG